MECSLDFKEPDRVPIEIRLTETVQAYPGAKHLADLVEPGVAALGFAAFSITMTGGRLLGDHLAMRFGAANLVRSGGLCASIGLILAILVPQAAPVLLGFAAVGAGLSIVVPLAFSAAGNVSGLPSGVGIAGVATIGYSGFLAGPPAIGLVAEITTLRIAMLLVLLLVGSLVYTSQALRRPRLSEQS